MRLTAFSITALVMCLIGQSSFAGTVIKCADAQDSRYLFTISSSKDLLEESLDEVVYSKVEVTYKGPRQFTPYGFHQLVLSNHTYVIDFGIFLGEPRSLVLTEREDGKQYQFTGVFHQGDLSSNLICRKFISKD